ncbi:hypothetical protein LNQ81_13210 [Myroides sp. M-43]|uniref:hypothetical protein n=1 Tax=Myroides oncorhynchi TaxID=2893756 RepID=UPI001E603230|nr:hypothetical protein [Myroides oncorhynchi]MCC9043632.1 hypothetical protein [Myroides oncorhynchi]
MKKRTLHVSKNFKNLSVLFFSFFTCLLAFGQNNQIKDVILVDATQLENKVSVRILLNNGYMWL